MWSDLAHEAPINGKTIHLGRGFGTCVITHAELDAKHELDANTISISIELYSREMT